MTDKEAARSEIAALAEKFRATPKATRDGYNEDETRHFFILPLFRALGWDTSSPADMSAETQISRGFVDFGFYLNGVPAFYLETKRIKEDLEKPEFIRQAINYAYLKGVTWAVLTDFEGLHIYNADWETGIPAQARYLALTWEDYAEADFEDLWLLSKPAMQERLLDKRATKHGKKARRVPVTELLFKNMTDWRSQLFNQMRFLSGQLWSRDVREIDNAVQRLLDRLIFLRTVEDRGLEERRLLELVRQNQKTPGKVWPGLLALFTEMNEVYNSNLFAPANLDLIDLHDPDLIRGIINDLYKYAGVEFDFNAISADVLGAVYEQYLGFRAQDLESRVEMKGKQEKRKKQGIYYTPQYIVRYIVQQTVGRLLEEGADPHALRILDPACGSGSFLIEAFDVLDRWLATHEPHTPAVERRRRILTENLYGVDLDEQAVEVTRLNLLLRASLERGKLPLLTNIQRGNSLIDDPAVAGDTAFVWEKAFPNVFAAGGFDAVIGNPPYGAELNLVEQTYISGRFKTGNSGATDTYLLFIEQSLRRLNGNGLLGFITPDTFLRKDRLESARVMLVNNSRLEELVETGPVFKQARDTWCLITIARTGSPTESSTVSRKQISRFTVSVEERLEQFAQRQWSRDVVEQQTLWANDSLAIGYLLSAGEQSLIAKLASYPSLGSLKSVYVISRGEEGSKLNLTGDKSGDMRMLIPADIERYGVGEGLLVRSDSVVEPKLRRFYTHPKIWAIRIQKLRWPRRIVSALDSRLNTAGMKTLQVIVSKSDDFRPLCYLQGILASRLINFWCVNYLVDDMNQSYLEKLPIRTIDPANPADVARHDQIVAHVEEMIALKQRMAEPNMAFNDERFTVAKRIEDVDREIDALIYALYGLTPEEIALVEGTA